MDRRDSKKSGSKQRQKDKSGKGKSNEEAEDDRKGLVRTKFPCREIYRPPSMRKQRTNSTGSHHDMGNHNFQNGNNNNNNNNCGQSSISPIARPSNNSSRTFNVHAKEFQFAQLDPQQQQQQYSHYNQSQSNPFFSSNRNPNNNGEYYSNGLKSSPILASSGCYPLQQSKSSGNVNNHNNNFYQLWHQQQQQVQSDLQPKQREQRSQGQSGLVSEQLKGSSGVDEDSAMYTPRHVPIQQSKSSGNLSLRQSDNVSNGGGLRHSGSNFGGKTVRFDFQDQRSTLPVDDNHKINHDCRDFADTPMDRFSRMKRDLDFAEQSFVSLQIDGEAQSIVRPGTNHQENVTTKGMTNVNLSPQQNSKFRHSPNTPTSQPVPSLQLQKSRTTFYMDSNSVGRNLGNHEMDSPTKEGGPPRSNNHLIRRSKSFGIVPKSTSSLIQSQPQSPTFVPPPPLSSTELLSSPDFDLASWPKSIQESILAVMTTSTDRVPVRNRIEMVTKIFSVILREYRESTVTAKGESKVSPSESHQDNNQASKVDNKCSKDCEGVVQTPKNNSDSTTTTTSSPNPTDLISSAVEIFLYLIQREKDRTVMESVTNTCFDVFQRLQRMLNKTSPNSQDNSKWIAFLQFLSAMYTRIKVFRLQTSQQPGMKSFEELNFTLLSLLCDSCLINLRSPLLQTSETMDPLFKIMMSIGRDMEMLFPSKMKQILAAVRDALLGIRPFSTTFEAPSPSVQKTLMQLIELHAANWHLSSSAIFYYFGNSSK